MCMYNMHDRAIYAGPMQSECYASAAVGESYATCTSFRNYKHQYYSRQL